MSSVLPGYGLIKFFNNGKASSPTISYGNGCLPSNIDLGGEISNDLLIILHPTREFRNIPPSLCLSCPPMSTKTNWCWESTTAIKTIEWEPLLLKNALP